MTEKRKSKRKGHSDDEESDSHVDEAQPSKIDYKIANFMKSKVPTKRTKFLNHPVNFFSSNKAIDVLLDSPWAKGGEKCLFTTRESVVKYCNKLLTLKFFHRAKKIVVKDRDLTVKELKKIKNKDDKKDNKKEIIEDKDGKKKKKIRLDMHLEQVFVDGSEAYVWMYDKIPFWYYIVGAFFLFAAVGICLFPLWPPSVRQGVYYLSIGAAGFLGVIIGLAILRFIIFMIIWTLSVGRHHFWILPNLTEDVGFLESFWPLYYYEYKGETYDDMIKDKKKEIKKKNKTSDAEDTVETQSALDTDKPDTDCDGKTYESKDEQTDSENSNSQAFEMVEKEDLSDQKED